MTDGALAFAALARSLRAADQTRVKNQLLRGVRQAALPLLDIATDAVVAVSPKRGGMAEREKGVVFHAKTSTGIRTAGVSIQADKYWVAAKTLNNLGRFRHPVHGEFRVPLTIAVNRKRWKWVTQAVPGAQGYLPRALDPWAPAVRDEIDKVINALLVEIARDSLGGR